MIDDPENASIFLFSRLGKARFAAVTAENCRTEELDDLLEGEKAEFTAAGKAVCTVTLCRPETWSAVGVRYPHGLRRRANLQIELSADGGSFHTVFNGQSSGKTRDFEDFTFPAQTVRAVRFTFNGNNRNPLTTVSGIRFTQK